MKLLVPTNFQDNLISSLDKKQVQCLYGKLPVDIIGGARHSFILPPVSRRQARRHIGKAHENGLEFNYLLNAVCLGNREYTVSGQRRIHSLLDWLAGMKIDSLTVSIPYLVQLIKKEYPQFKIHISAAAGVDSLLKAQYWQGLGADCITLQSTSLNRDFESLKNIREYVKCKLALISNESCLYKCPVSHYHCAASSHASQSSSYIYGAFIDYCLIRCKKARLEEPVNIIRSAWIRPEDAHYYQEIGIDYLKIVDRSKDADFILKAVNAYINKSYEGNLAELFPLTSGGSAIKGIGRYTRCFRYLFSLFTANIFKMSGVIRAPRLEVYLDNRALDGFLEFFLQGKCRGGICEECGYCQEISDKAVKIDKSYREKAVLEYGRILDNIILWPIYHPKKKN